MRYAYSSLALIAIGLVGFAIIMVFNDVTVNNEADYYTLKEAMEASMLEAVDITCYRLAKSDGGCGGEIKISKEKFVSNFTRRFAKTVTGDSKGYTLSFYNIMEKPPKASIVILDNTSAYNIRSDDSNEFDIYNSLTGVIDAYVSDDTTTEELCPGGSIKNGSNTVTYYTSLPSPRDIVSYVLNADDNSYVLSGTSANRSNLVELHMSEITIESNYMTSAMASSASGWQVGKAIKKYSSASGWTSLNYGATRSYSASTCDFNVASSIIIINNGDSNYFVDTRNGTYQDHTRTVEGRDIHDYDYVIKIVNNASSSKNCSGPFELTYKIKWDYKYCQ